MCTVYDIPAILYKMVNVFSEFSPGAQLSGAHIINEALDLITSVVGSPRLTDLTAQD